MRTKNHKIIIRLIQHDSGWTAKYYGCIGTGATPNEAWENLKGNLWAADMPIPSNIQFEKVKAS